MTQVKQAALLGGGVIGGGWAARLALNGIDVTIFDPNPDAPRMVAEVMANAERAYDRLTVAPLPKRGQIRFASTVAEAVRDADFIQESAPERVELKQKLFAEVDQYARPDVLIGSSTSGILPSVLQERMKHPERLVVAHPFNPVYLLPLVEIVGGKQTSADSIARAKAFYASIGMKPVHIRKEIEAFVGDRLLEALWREALWLVHDDIATAEEIDDVIRYSFGLRWAQMGTFMVYRVAGGEAGMRHFMNQFGPCLSWPWTKLMDVPEYNEALVDKIVAQSDAQAGGLSIRELERIRDDNLIGIMQALKGNNWGAGALLKDYEAKLLARAHAAAPDALADPSQPLRLVETRVRPEWIDYNGHMTESRYLQVFGDTSDALLLAIGAGPAYRDSGFSWYTVETHIRHKGEAKGNDPIRATCQILATDEKRLHVFHRIEHATTGALLATAEQMLLHVDSKAGRACPAPQAQREQLARIARAHAALPVPEGAGRFVGQR